MLSKEVVELSKQHSIIRDIFEYGMKRAKEVGAENVFDLNIRINDVLISPYGIVRLRYFF
mgnify:CR=1 FL=1